MPPSMTGVFDFNDVLANPVVVVVIGAFTDPFPCIHLGDGIL